MTHVQRIDWSSRSVRRNERERVRERERETERENKMFCVSKTVEKLILDIFNAEQI